jgi:ATP-dependent helicase/nuclease subunit B
MPNLLSPLLQSAYQALQKLAGTWQKPLHKCVVLVPNNRLGLAFKHYCIKQNLSLLPRIVVLQGGPELAYGLGLTMPENIRSPALPRQALWQLSLAAPAVLPAKQQVALAQSMWQLAIQLGHYGHNLNAAVPYAPSLAPYTSITNTYVPESLYRHTLLNYLAEQLTKPLTTPLLVLGFKSHGLPPAITRFLSALGNHACVTIISPPETNTSNPLAYRTIVAAQTPAEEARLATLATQHALSQNLTPTLVCASASLTAMLAQTLYQAGFAVNSSAGTLLATTPAGHLLGLLLDVVAEPTALNLQALCSHPNVNPTLNWPHLAHLLDTYLWRGPQVSTNIQGNWADWQSALPQRLHNTRLPEDTKNTLNQAFNVLSTLISPLFTSQSLAQHHAKVLQALHTLCPSLNNLVGATEVIALLSEESDNKQASHTELYTAYTQQQLNTYVVHSASQPGSIAILGPQEARLLEPEALIMCGLNQGVWPSQSHNPWLNPTAVKALGLPDDTTTLQHATEDFLHSWFNPNLAFVVATYTKHNSNAVPVLLSPLLEQLKSHPQHAAWQSAGYIYHNWHNQLNHPHALTAAWQNEAENYAEKPAVFNYTSSKPLRWSASYLTTLISCPYRAVLEKNLKIEAPIAYNTTASPAAHGNLLHTWLEAFEQAVPGLPGPWQGPITPNTANQAISLLQSIATELLKPMPVYSQNVLAPRMEVLGRQLVNYWLTTQCHQRHAEVWLESSLNGIGFYAKADLITQTCEGSTLIDYKTGTPPSWADVAYGRKPQLALEAWLLHQQKQPLSNLEFWHLKGYGTEPLEILSLSDSQQSLPDIINQTHEGLNQLTNHFNQTENYPATPHAATCKNCHLAGVCRHNSWHKNTEDNTDF